MYVTFNLFAAKPYTPVILINNLFSLVSTSVLFAGINFVGLS